MNNSFQNVKGFTLMELMVVVAIMAILASIGIPIYDAQVEKSRRTEGRALLTSLLLAQERAYTANGQYVQEDSLTSLSMPSGVSVEASKMTSENGYYEVTLAVPDDGQSFTATAAPKSIQAGDTTCGSLSITHLNVKGESGTGDVGDCW